MWKKAERRRKKTKLDFYWADYPWQVIHSHFFVIHRINDVNSSVAGRCPFEQTRFLETFVQVIDLQLNPNQWKVKLVKSFRIDGLLYIDFVSGIFI